MVNVTLAEEIATTPLIDHHVHGALRDPLDQANFEATITESDRPAAPGVSSFDSPVGFALLRVCAPLLDLEGEVSGARYVERRLELGPEEVNRRLLRASGIAAYLIDTGFHTDGLLEPGEMAAMGEAQTYEVVRLEAIAQRLLDAETSPTSFADELERELVAARERGAVGSKSVLAYRSGFDIDTTRPDRGALRQAIDRQLARTTRVDEPVLLAHLLWAGVDLGLPLQIHTGFGDTDLTLHRANPSLLTPFLRESESAGVPVVLLHCYPYHREAGYLAQMFPHVYFDVGEAINYAGAQSRQVVAESFALAPFAKQLFSSDAWGPAELHVLGAILWRRAMARVLGEWVADGDWSETQARRVVQMVASENARSVYRI